MSHPIGIFDSGVGGLSILIETRKALPEENLLYFADSGYCPYGTKPETEILDRALKITDFLLKQGVKAIVIACNAASTASLDGIRKQYPQMPVIGIEPAVKPACLTTKTGKIGVLSTSLTLQGKRFSSLVEKYGKNVEIFTQPATGLARSG
ncbi:MAG: glutamate racemase [Bacteroidota bacterium]